MLTHEQNESSGRPAMKTPLQVVASPRISVAVWLFDENEQSEFAVKLKNQFMAYDYSLILHAGMANILCCDDGKEPDFLVIKIAEPLCNKAAEDLQKIFLKIREKTCPVLYIAPGDDFHSRLYAARLGAQAYLLDSILPEELCEQVAEFVEGTFYSQIKVLILSDDRDLAERYQQKLLDVGIRVVIETEAETIADRLSEFQPDLLLIKQHMFGYSAADIVMVIRQLDVWTYLPIIYLSAPRETVINQILRSGPEGVLQEPLSAKELNNIVRHRIRLSRKLKLAASKDCLTGLLNQRSVKESVARVMLRMQRVEKPVTLVMLDVDKFKLINDTYGHVVGDKVLHTLAMLLRSRLRRSDLLGRYGGDEFLLALPECDEEEAVQLMTTIRQQVEGHYFFHQGKPFHCTISVGVASTHQYPFYDIDELTDAADRALYHAKQTGRNKVTVLEAVVVAGGE
ncbi:GGDEF domain-containing protein [Porticoccus sp.]